MLILSMMCPEKAFDYLGVISYRELVEKVMNIVSRGIVQRETNLVVEDLKSRASIHNIDNCLNKIPF